MEVSEPRNKQENKSISIETLFSQAAIGDINALKYYLAKNGGVNRRDEDGMALIHYAACRGDVHLIHQLRRYGAEMNLRDGGTPPWKPVHYAIFHRQHGAEKLLIELGAQVPLSIVKQVITKKRRSQYSDSLLPGTPGTKKTWDKQLAGVVAMQPKPYVVDRSDGLLGLADAIELGPTR